MYRVYVLLSLSEDSPKEFSSGFSLVYRSIIFSKKAITLLWRFARVFQQCRHDCNLQRTLHEPGGSSTLACFLKAPEEFLLSSFISTAAGLSQFPSIL